MIIAFFELTSMSFPSSLHLARSIPKVHSIHLRALDKLSLKFSVATFKPHDGNGRIKYGFNGYASSPINT